MRQFLMCVTLAALVCGVALTAPSRNPAHRSADATAAAKDAVVKLENLWLENEGNPTVLDSILADDFVHVFPGGFITKQQHIDFVRQHPFPPMKMHRFEKLEVRIYGDIAIANGIVLAAPENGAARRTYFTDVFVLRDGHWQAVNAQESEANGTSKP